MSSSRSSIQRRASFLALAVAAGAWILSSGASAQTAWYVNASAPPGGTGQSWAQAFRRLQTALDFAIGGDVVYVAAGRYVPTKLTDPGDPRSATFLVRGDILLYGGFAGTETHICQRTGLLYQQTVLDGDIGIQNDPSDNAYHVVSVREYGAVIDGFLVKNGNANGAGTGQNMGAGICGQASLYNHIFLYPEFTVMNCFIRDNLALTPGGSGPASGSGAGLSMRRGKLRMSWVSFFNNHADFGGGLSAKGVQELFVQNCWFRSNSATIFGGGVRIVDESAGLGSAASFANCLFFDNLAGAEGGGAYLGGLGEGSATYSRADWLNCSFAENAAFSSGGGIQAGPPIGQGSRVRNSILWGNSTQSLVGADLGGMHTVDYSTVGVLWPGPGNLATDPQFVNPLGGDLRLQPSSQAIDSGNTMLVPLNYGSVDNCVVGAPIYSDPLTGWPLVPLDLQKEWRILDDANVSDGGVSACVMDPCPPELTVDRGAYEHRGP